MVRSNLNRIEFRDIILSVVVTGQLQQPLLTSLKKFDEMEWVS